ncbi:TatD family hydrolase [Candidimonas nitroreducens]|uniref:DNAase n=1 Tax=Candidimonas nitroreducens TaxID=683354 RepID=A0A225MWP8_9BURK|nr:TatD family hydrolase [Candidimonas nitroreducens]OWT65688.1 DNAase [Candidimonas nitroreducens]
MLIDTHCHLDASEFDADRREVIQRAAGQGVRAIVIPAVERGNFTTVRSLAHSFEGGAYALGIHPMCVPRAQPADLEALEACVQASLADPRFVAIGEIGLDFFVPELCTEAMRARQETFYAAQLELARQHGLPVLLHVRRSQDQLLKHLRRKPVAGGMAHAFNGSFQQAAAFIDMGFALGMGGAMTFERALQIRRLAAQLPLDALALETDAPDIPPAWLGGRGLPRARNEPGEVARIGAELARLRGLDAAQVAAATAANALRVLPRLASVVPALA